MGIIDAWLDGYIASSLLAKELGLKSKDFRHTSLDSVKFKRTLLIRVPKEAIPFIKNYTPVLLDGKSDGREYEYILRISKTKRVGFWR